MYVLILPILLPLLARKGEWKSLFYSLYLSLSFSLSLSLPQPPCPQWTPVPHSSLRTVPCVFSQTAIVPSLWRVLLPTPTVAGDTQSREDSWALSVSYSFIASLRVILYNLQGFFVNKHKTMATKSFLFKTAVPYYMWINWPMSFQCSNRWLVAMAVATNSVCTVSGFLFMSCVCVFVL